MTESFNSTPPARPDFAPPTNQAIAIATLTRRMAGGAANFFWIAGLSVINSVLAFVGSNTRFVIGLGFTQFIDAVAHLVGRDVPQANTILTVVAFLIDLVIVGLFAFFGYFSRKGHRWAFITGMILYALDAMLMFVFQDWLAFGFHLFFLFGLFGGLRALNQLKKMTAPQKVSDFPQNIGAS